MIALAIGCVLSDSIAWTALRRSERFKESARFSLKVKSITFISPCVNVPVLSKTTVLIVLAISREPVFRNTIPRCAPLPVATRNATGVANPRAHGQAMTNTATAVAIDRWSEYPEKYQSAKVPAAITSTTGTKNELMRSANC